MRSLPRIVKYYEAESHIEKYIFKTQTAEAKATVTVEDQTNDDLEYLQGFLEELEEDSGQEESLEEGANAVEESKVDYDEELERDEEEEFSPAMTEKEAEEILAEARRQAEGIIKDAEEQSKQMEKEGYASGYERGNSEGFAAAHEEQRKILEEESYKFLMELEAIVSDVEQRKVELMLQYRKDLKNIAIAVGEKVIQVSLKSSGDVIERMIVSATEKLKRKEWMKIYIAKCDAEALMAGDSQLMRNLSHISKHAKLILMENETPGTCIIELPDEIIDASVQTQVANIKEILNNASI